MFIKDGSSLDYSGEDILNRYFEYIFMMDGWVIQ